MSRNRTVATAFTNIIAKGQITSDGGNSTGDDNNFLTLDVDFTGYVNYLLFVNGHTAISEDGNTAYASRLRIILTETPTGNSTVIAGSRQGIGAHTGPSWTGDTTAYMAASGYYVITSTYAAAGKLKLNGGINSGAFHWGDQPSHVLYDNENLGGSLYYILFKQ